jgi:hypothetical protein
VVDGDQPVDAAAGTAVAPHEITDSMREDAPRFKDIAPISRGVSKAAFSSLTTRASITAS